MDGGLTLKQKIKIIGLSKERVQELQEMQVETIDYSKEKQAQLQIINCDEIVGVDRFYAKNWLEVLYIKLHKLRKFTEYNEERFKNLL